MMFERLCTLRICALGTRCFRRRLLVSDRFWVTATGYAVGMFCVWDTDMVREMFSAVCGIRARWLMLPARSLEEDDHLIIPQSARLRLTTNGTRQGRDNDSLQCSAPCLLSSAYPVRGAVRLTGGNHPQTHGRKG